jgi:hypothetical protein
MNGRAPAQAFVEGRPKPQQQKEDSEPKRNQPKLQDVIRRKL